METGMFLAPIIGLHPALAIFLIGASISLLMSLVNKKVLGSERAKDIKKRMQEMRESMLKAQKSGDSKKSNEHLMELMKINSEYLKIMMKPILVSMVLLVLILVPLREFYSGRIIATVPETFPVVGGFELTWFWWYFICAFIVSMVAKKLLGI